MTADRYTMPDFEATGEPGLRDVFESTAETQHRYLNDPEMADWPGYFVIGGTWTTNDDGTEWLVIERAEEQQ